MRILCKGIHLVQAALVAFALMIAVAVFSGTPLSGVIGDEWVELRSAILCVETHLSLSILAVVFCVVLLGVAARFLRSVETRRRFMFSQKGGHVMATTLHASTRCRFVSSRKRKQRVARDRLCL